MLPHFRIPRPAIFEERKSRLVSAGSRHLQVILDFDHTLTRFVLPSGRDAPMCHDVIENSPLMPTRFQTGFAQIWEDQREGLKQGTWSWSDWWTRSHNLMCECGLQREWIPDMIASSGLQCRGKCKELFGLCHSFDVPVMIMSAGLKDLIVEVLTQAGIDTSKVHIVANEMTFDHKTGKLQSVSEPPITSVNKRSISTRQATYFESIQRKHVLIVGDSLGDCDCLETLAGLEEALRIGFFNARKRADKLKAYEATFDFLVSNEALDAEHGEDFDCTPLMQLLTKLLQSAEITQPE